MLTKQIEQQQKIFKEILRKNWFNLLTYTSQSPETKLNECKIQRSNTNSIRKIMCLFYLRSVFVMENLWNRKSSRVFIIRQCTRNSSAANDGKIPNIGTPSVCSKLPEACRMKLSKLLTRTQLLRIYKFRNSNCFSTESAVCFYFLFLI